MRAVIQLVSEASVKVDGSATGEIEYGLMVLLGVGKSDTEKDAEYIANKIVGLRIFPDHEKLMNRSLADVNGEMLVVSQFTLYGDCKKGRRPSFSHAAPPDQADRLYQYFMNKVQNLNIRVASGKFQAMMEVSLVNQGPVTIIIDSA